MTLLCMEPFVKVFLCGNPSNGKSTLAKVLQSETKNRMTSIARRIQGAQAKGVNRGTAGINLTSFHSSEFGRVLLHDFAGHYEYYGSHAAILDITVSSSTPVFFIVLNLEDDSDTIMKQLEYWMFFIANHCKSTLAKPNIIVVGSHLDRLKARGEDPGHKKALIEERAKAEAAESSNIEFVGYVQLDCRVLEWGYVHLCLTSCFICHRPCFYCILPCLHLV